MTITLPVTVICSILNICGIICAMICLLFNIIFRKKKSISRNIKKKCITCTFYLYYRLVRLDSPNLNYLIISGTTMVFAGGIAFVAPTLDPRAVSALCIVCPNTTFKSSYPNSYIIHIPKLVEIHNSYSFPIILHGYAPEDIILYIIWHDSNLFRRRFEFGCSQLDTHLDLAL